MNETFCVKDKVILVTGASSGLGCHFAKILARYGAKVALCARRFDKLKTITNEINQAGGVAIPFALDVTQSLAIKDIVKEIENQLGNIDVLINNAGVDARTNIFATAEADWTPVIDTNLKGMAMVTQAVAARMIENKTVGSIINISSVSDVLGFKGGNPAYMMSKAGVSHFTHLLALELADANIRVNAIAPGVYRTEINNDLFETDLSKTLETKIPLSRFGQLKDLNGSLLLLCSEASSYMTGTIIRVDGGLGINKLLL